MNTIARKGLIICLLSFCLLPVFSQILSKKEFIKAVQIADGFYYYDEDFEKAASLYEPLLKSYPDNFNLCAKLGICYLNIDGKKANALKLLEKASQNIVKTDKEYEEYGDEAPLDTYMYLAIAFHQNDSLVDAVTQYTNARKKLGRTQIFRDDFIDKQIKDCRYAMEVEKTPLKINESLFAPWLADYPGALNPAVSANDSVFVFTVKKDGKTRILCSFKNGSWKKPRDITKQLGSNNGFYTNSITANGNILIIYVNDGGDGNLYYSQRKDSTWTRIKSFGKVINTIFWESHGTITPDGKTLYFTSNRPGGVGELDIWVSERDADGSWKRPVNCGKVINTPYNETTPFYDESTNSLLFSSEGHSGMGGYDVFRSYKKNGVWTQAIGLPYSFNSTIENTFFIPDQHDNGYVTSLYNEKSGTRNIYSLVTDDAPVKTIRAEGTVTLQDGMAVDPLQTHIQLFDQKSGALLKNITLADTGSFKYVMKPGQFKVLISRVGDKTDTINLNVKKETQPGYKTITDTASYRFEIKPGDYQLFINHIGYKTDTINLSLPAKFYSSYISVNSSLIPDKVFNGEFLAIRNLLFEYNSYSLTEKAISTLEILKSVLLRHPTLNIEVSGYTDAKGSAEYNKSLADKRAQSIISYLSASGISGSRFVKKVIGNTDFIARNTNPDGSDNPEGRKYNRRVTFGIINPRTGIVISQETYVPEHLRQPNSIKYSIILERTPSHLSEEYFSNLRIDELLMIRSATTDSGNVYSIGEFNSSNDASDFLKYAKGKGFKDAFVTTPNSISRTSEILEAPVVRTSYYQGKKVYTVQLSASRQKLDMNQFKGIDAIKEVESADGYYRYIGGEYNSYTEAKVALEIIQKKGFTKAFIKVLNP